MVNLPQQPKNLQPKRSNMRKVLIATDSFKDALPAFSVCQAIERGFLLAGTDFRTVPFPLADGGEGTMEILAHHLELDKVTVEVKDPLFRSIRGYYYSSKDGQRAFVEMATASGLQLLSVKERNPEATTSLGTGQLIRHAIQNGAKQIILGIGGSATNDGGMGMAKALGYTFQDANGRELEPIGRNLSKVESIDKGESWQDTMVRGLCDVDNLLAGPQGAACIFAEQKGADPAAIERLDKGLVHFGKVLARTFGRNFSSVPGAGAAGGMGAGALAFFGANLESGIDAVLSLTNFQVQLQQTDVVITGEGKLDHQTQRGKLIQGICRLAQRFDKPVIAICGTLDLTPKDVERIGLAGAFSISQGPQTLARAIKTTSVNLEKVGFNIARLLILDKL